VIFPIFGLKLIWIFRYIVFIYPGSFFSVKATLKLQALDLLWRRSPLVPRA
jgi:hypothetical protein